MESINWTKQLPDLETSNYKGYLFRRRPLGIGFFYEIWKDGKLYYNALRYPEFLKLAQRVTEQGAI